MFTLEYQINVQHILFFFQNFPKIRNLLKPISWHFEYFPISIGWKHDYFGHYYSPLPSDFA